MHIIIIPNTAIQAMAVTYIQMLHTAVTGIDLPAQGNEVHEGKAAVVLILFRKLPDLSLFSTTLSITKHGSSCSISPLWMLNGPTCFLCH